MCVVRRGFESREPTRLWSARRVRGLFGATGARIDTVGGVGMSRVRTSPGSVQADAVWYCTVRTGTVAHSLEAAQTTPTGTARGKRHTGAEGPATATLGS